MAKSGQRLAWLDAAKGGAILLVVLHHVVLWLQPVDLVAPIFVTADHLLKQARMPLFFLASGIATSFIHKAPRGEFVVFKLLPIAWIFVLWTAVYGLALEGAAQSPPWSAGGLLFYLPGALIAGDHGMWFVMALGLMCLAALITRNFPPTIVLGLALAMTLYNDITAWPYHFPVFPDWIVHNLLNYAIFFFAGLYGSQYFIKRAGSPRTMRVVLISALLGFIAVNVAVIAAEAWFWRTQTVRAILGTAIGFSAAVLLSEVPKIGPALSWFGQRSLGVFLGHGLFLVPFVTLLPSGISGSTIWGHVMPLIATCIAVAGSLLLYLGLERIGLRWVYILPKRVGRSLLATLSSVRREQAAT